MTDGLINFYSGSSLAVVIITAITSIQDGKYIWGVWVCFIALLGIVIWIKDILRKEG